jgi:Phage portal protein, SPP1 Gp6-like
VPIDVHTPLSDGWWLQRLQAKLNSRRPHLDRLDAYFRGDAPLPDGAGPNLRHAYADFQRKARTNWAQLVVESCRERMIPVAFRTAAGGDDNGDEVAGRIWRANGLAVESADVHRTMLSLGDAYVIVGDLDPETGQPVITAEDPRQVVTEHDPRQQRKVRAGLKLFRDDAGGRDLAYLYLPAESAGGQARLRVAYREYIRPTAAAGAVPSGSWVWDGALQRRAVAPGPDMTAWEWDDTLSGQLPFPQVPVVRFRNLGGWGEFEHHLDLLDRLNHTILQRLVIVAVQAYRQRAVKGSLPRTDDDGNDIDYRDLFTADPGALWELPDGVDLWESGQADLTPVLSSVRDDLQALAAVTRTPLHHLQPESANQSAEGASLSREGLVFKAEDRIARAGEAWAQVMSLAFRWLGDGERADLLGIEPMWASPDRYSLAERADAAVKAFAAGVPARTTWQYIWQFTPEQVAEMEQQRADDALLAAAQQAAQQAAQPPARPGAGQPATGQPGRPSAPPAGR